MTVSITLTHEEIDYLIDQLSNNSISGAETIKIVSGLLQYLDEAKNMPSEPPPFDMIELQPLIDRLQRLLVDPLQALWPEHFVRMDALEGGRAEGDDFIFNIFVVIGNVTHSIPMQVPQNQTVFMTEFEAVKKLIEEEMLAKPTH